MRTPIHDWLRDHRQNTLDRRHARARFADETRVIDRLTEDLACTPGHAERGYLLNQLANAEEAATFYRIQGWRDLRVQLLGDWPPAVVLRHQATLHRLVADAESALADPTRTTRWYVDTSLEPTAGPVLDRALAAGRLDQAVLAELADAVAWSGLGEHATWAVRYLPMPGAQPDYHLSA